MSIWEIVISICAGILTLSSLFDKIGLTNSVLTLKEVPSQIEKLSTEVSGLITLQKNQNEALLSLIRNELYECFKHNREIEAWTDDECQVQTKLHKAYDALGGNGEEAIWWEKKKSWKILTNEEIQDLLNR